jgi:hypothetical protein
MRMLVLRETSPMVLVEHEGRKAEGALLTAPRQCDGVEQEKASIGAASAAEAPRQYAEID